jgi:hypothetical protein
MTPVATDKTSRIESVKKRIVHVSEGAPHTRILVFGPNKKGKTRFAATGPKVLIVDINEKGTRSVRGYEAHVFHAESWADVVYAYWFLKSGEHEFETVVIDTATQMQHACMKQVLKEAEDRDPYKDPHTPSQREWLKVAELMKPMILNFRNLPMHCIFLAQERSVDNEEGENERVPDLSPGSRGTLMASVDVIGRVFQKEVRVVKNGKEAKRWDTFMLVGPHDTYPTGNRMGLPRIIRNPTVQTFIEANTKEQ